MQRIYLLDTQNLQPRAIAHEIGNVSEVEWINDQEILAVSDDAFDIAQIFRIHTSKDTIQQLTEHQNINENRFVSLHLNPPFSYTDDIVRFRTAQDGYGYYQFQLNLKTNKIIKELRFTNQLDRAIPDVRLNTRVFEEWDGDTYSINYYPSDRKSKISLYSGTFYGEKQIHPLAIFPHDNLLYVTTNEGPRRDVRILDLDSQKLGEPIVTDQSYDVDAQVLYYPYSGDAYGFQYDRDIPTIHYVEQTTARTMKGIDGVLQNRFNKIVSASADRRQLIVHSSNERNPGEYYIYNVEKKTLRPLLSEAEWLNEESLFETRVIHYIARDGLQIEGYLTQPKKNNGSIPLIILPHGGPHVRDTKTYQPLVQFFASIGYAVLQPNFRLSTGYGVEHFRKGLREVGYAIQHDIEDGLLWAKKNGYGSSGNVCIVGTSFGAYTALRAATLHPNNYRCVIAVAGFYDINMLLAADEQKSFFPIMKAMYGDPKKDFERLTAASPIHDVSKIEAPVLIVHGSQDARVDVKQALNLKKALERENKMVETLFLPDEGHGFRKTSNRLKLYLTLEKFLAKHLPVDEAGGEHKP